MFVLPMFTQVDIRFYIHYDICMTKCIIWLCSQSVCYRNWIEMIKDMRRLGLLLPRDLIRLSPCPSFAFSPHAAAAASTSAAAFPKGETAMNVFDRKAKALHRDRSVIIRDDHQVFDYLKEEVGYRVYDRILDIKRRRGFNDEALAPLHAIAKPMWEYNAQEATSEAL